MNAIKMCEIIRESRINKRMSQKELAEKVGLTQQSIALLEHGKRNLSFDLFIDIIKALELSQDELKNIINAIILKTNPKIPEEQLLVTLNTDIPVVITKSENPLPSAKDSKELRLLSNYRILNDIGKKEAVKRVQELTEIKKYTEPDRQQKNTTELNAAHELPNATDEDKKHDDNIMDDDDEW